MTRRTTSSTGGSVARAATVVALLRGINVGRAKRIAMADLRAALAGLGYEDVRTLLNSGNAVFRCPTRRAAAAADDIRTVLERDHALRCDVVTRTADELAAVVSGDPLREVATDPSRHLIGFLAEEPGADAVRAVEDLEVAPDAIRVVGLHAYLWCPAGVLASPLTKLGWERRLGVVATARNQATVTRLAEMAAG